jgi:hypothetical protein
VLARLRAKTIVGFEHVSPRGPRMRCSARHLAVPQMSGRGATVLRREVELCGRLVVESRGRLERLAQFQTLTSR